MTEYLRLARPYFVLLALMTAARWVVSFRQPYEVATDKVSIVIMTIWASIFYGAFCRKWRGFGVIQAMLLGALLSFSAQIVIFIATLVSYLAHLDTYFNYYRALNATTPGPVPLPDALMTRLQGLVGNPILASITGLIGWALGALVPGRK